MSEARRRPSFAEAYDAHVRDVYGFFAYRLGARQDVEDLTQLTFERALRAWGRFDPERAQPATWLLAIARNALIDHWRTDRSERNEPLEPHAERLVEGAPTGAGTAAGAGGAVLGEGRELGLEPELERALAGLSDRERELLALRFGADLSGAQIAELTGTSLAAVQQALSRSLRRLRVELEPGVAEASSARAGSSEPSP